MKELEIKSIGTSSFCVQNKVSVVRSSAELEKKKWLEVIPHGLVGGMMPNLCLMVFKEKSGSKRFALSLSQLQGKISLDQSLNREEPFRFIGEIFNAVGISIEKCYFLSNEKGFIRVQVFVSGTGGKHCLSLQANDVIPFAIYSGCRFFCTSKFISEMLEQKLDHPLKKHSIRKPLYLN